VSWPHAGLGAGGGPAGLAGWVAVLTSFGWRWRPATGSLHRGHGRAWLGLVAGEQSSGGRPSQGWSPTPATATPDGCWSRRPGITATLSAQPAAPGPPRRPARAVVREHADHGTAGCSSAGAGWTPGPALHHQRGRGRPQARRMVLEPGRPGGLTEHPSRPVGGTHQRQEQPATHSEQPGRSNRRATPDLSTSRPLPTHTRSCARPPDHGRPTAHRVSPPRPPAQPSTPPPRRPAHAPATW